MKSNEGGRKSGKPKATALTAIVAVVAFVTIVVYITQVQQAPVTETTTLRTTETESRTIHMTETVTHTIYTTQTTVYDFSSAIEQVNPNSLRVKILEFYSKKTAVIGRDNPLFEELLQRLSNSTLVSVTPKTDIIIKDGQITTAHITILYPYGDILTFQLKDRSIIWFNCEGENVWYETVHAIYKASIDPKIYAVINEIISESEPTTTRSFIITTITTTVPTPP